MVRRMVADGYEITLTPSIALSSCAWQESLNSFRR
ncbi:hypothetical protein N183_21815 [Sinorhizobium sp. Sb3]|nr:hypothetical protein N183_21815 [Sinorhizobium sp. Sb3]